MRKLWIVSVLVLSGCGSSGDDVTTTTDTGTSPADTAVDTSASDTESPIDSTTGDTTTDAPSDAPSDGDAGGCPASWTVAPVVDPSIAVPDGGGGVLLHAQGVGTQNYKCMASTPSDAGADADDAGTTYAWTLTGPEADLKDCMMNKIGTHFASDAGASAPEWMTIDGTDVIAKKNAAYTPPDSGAVPWLLLQATAHSGTGTLSKVLYIQRVNTTGGKAPATGCDASAVGMTTKIAYTADYWFFGTP